jgi:hypothetical protein
MAKNRDGQVKVMVKLYNPIRGCNTWQFVWVKDGNFHTLESRYRK